MSTSFRSFEQRIGNIVRRFPDSPKREVVLTRLYFHAFKLLNDLQNKSLSEFGLNSSSWLALVMIYSTEENAINPCELSYAMISSRTNITRLSDELVEKGWVERAASLDDRRKIVLSLTEKGRQLVEEVLPMQGNLYKDIWSELAPEEVNLFEVLLRKLLARLEEEA